MLFLVNTDFFLLHLHYACSLYSSQEYNEENLRKALDLQKTMEADMGGTEIFKPLKGIFKQKPSTSHSRQVSSLNIHP